MAQNNALNLETEATMKALLDLMIPPSESYKMPGGADIGFENNLDSQTKEWIQSELLRLNAESFARYGKSFHLTATTEQQTTMEAMKTVLRPFFSRLLKILLESYYLHPEVRKAIGCRDGPAFPEGYQVDEGDLTLLESVNDGPKKFRETCLSTKN
jgi:hypothetical protein